ncbi:MAG: hypothetical protein HRT37_21990 [Alteromonadaceae bacterium]|nr:hypothetical protein [Alteromonadaceae bacterium]
MATITVSAGDHTIRVDSNSGNFNLNWISIELTTGGVVDADNDGVDDAIDQCPGTPTNTVVDAVGCAVVIDADNDGVDDAIDQCLGTPANTAVDAVGCAVIGEKFGIIVASVDSIDFFVNVNAWADVHYILNGGGQQNFRMTNTANGNIKTLSGLNHGDIIGYNFTYFDDDGTAKDSVWTTYTFVGN